MAAASLAPAGRVFVALRGLEARQTRRRLAGEAARHGLCRQPHQASLLRAAPGILRVPTGRACARRTPTRGGPGGKIRGSAVGGYSLACKLRQKSRSPEISWLSELPGITAKKA